VLLLVTLVGCSRTDLVYSNADWLLQRWAAGLLDPESGQRDAWELVMEQAMQSHRRDLLPDVIQILRTAEVAAGDGLDPQELSCWSRQLEQAYRDHANWAVGPAAAVLGDVSPSQIDHLAAELRERNQEYREDYLDEDPERRHQARVERYTERIERWTGDLSTDQLRLVEQAVSAMPDLAEGWLAYREERQLRLLELLRAGVDRAALEDYLGAWWIDLEGRPAALAEEAEVLRLLSLDLVLRLDASLSVGQRATFVDKVAGVRNDFERLMGEQGQQVTAQAAADPCVAASRSLSN
jgi:hypothetical protein